MNGSPFEMLGETLAAATRGARVIDVLGDLIRDLSVVLDVHAIGILARADTGEMDLLSATSHRMAELEMYQAVDDEGPCVDCIRSGATVLESGDDILARWPTVGPLIAAAGFQSVLSIPMVWRSQPIAGLNLFWRRADEPSAEQQQVAQAFADAATLILGQTPGVHAIARNVVSALHARTIVEQAKGAIAYQEGINMEQAFGELCRRAQESGVPLSEVARTLLSSYATSSQDHDGA